MNYYKFILAKIKYWYYAIFLRIFYNRKPNEDGTFDLMSSPSFKDAVLKK